MYVFSDARISHFLLSVTLTFTRWPWYELDLDTLRMYVHTKNEIPRSTSSKVEQNRATQTDRRDRTNYQPHSLVVIMTFNMDYWRSGCLNGRQPSSYCTYISLFPTCKKEACITHLLCYLHTTTLYCSLEIISWTDVLLNSDNLTRPTTVVFRSSHPSKLVLPLYFSRYHLWMWLVMRSVAFVCLCLSVLFVL